MKRKITALALLAMMGTQPTHATFGGFRVGLGLGLQMLQGRHTYTGPKSPASDQHIRLGAFSYLLGAHGGYLFELTSEKLVLGLEAYLLMPGAKPSKSLQLVNSANKIDGQVNIQHKNSIGVAGTIGMMLNPKVMVYLNLGIEMAKFELKYSNSAVTASPTQKVGHSFTGFTPALGFDYKFSPHFLIGAQLSSPFWKAFTNTSTPPGPDHTYKFRPVERRLLIRFTYLL
jgi:opacity protein-like surface antigen